MFELLPKCSCANPLVVVLLLVLEPIELQTT